MSQKFGDHEWHPETRALRYFVAVAEEKSVTKAAARLRIAQPAISRQIAALEQDLATTLFLRLPRGVELTEAGEILLERCYATFSILAQGYRDVTAHSSAPKGVVVLGLPPTPGEFILPPLLSRIKAQYPDIELRLVEGFSRELEKALLRGDIALAVMHEPPERSDILRRELLVEHLNIVGPPGSLSKPSFTLAEAAQLPLVMPSRPNFLRIMFDRACDAHGYEPNVVQRVDGMWHLKALVRSGHGFTALTYGGVLTEINAGTLECRPIVAPQIGWQLSIATRAEQRPKVAVSVVEDAIFDIVADLVHRGVWQ
ncbi:LysR family transcriptional regulator [Frigidibacter albus]|uniref:LysR family transcriptional regulator n=1 Tax=Frigidibacter albus TaxID=1465486 RepID=A0A6L8VD11_9RHOB|nr:LysR family transcriptional regulator [Frigidibacter albus]MZQ87512.1 LysR family transcriptional regulator [Frigidibacter albus]NBE29418.1 LysR family transcriptional regulator [Frigidibacter albus]GGH45049.1 LysR family transcriptional regulator [Frigidibacter albus]